MTERKTRVLGSVPPFRFQNDAHLKGALDVGEEEVAWGRKEGKRGMNWERRRRKHVGPVHDLPIRKLKMKMRVKLTILGKIMVKMSMNLRMKLVMKTKTKTMRKRMGKVMMMVMLKDTRNVRKRVKLMKTK